MGISRVINRRTAVLGLLLVILATAGFGFAAQNTVNESWAGDGTGDISGYTVSNIRYTLNTTDPAELNGISFDLTGSAVVPLQVKARIVGEAWSPPCTTTSTSMPANFVCSISGAVLDAENLQVVAAQ
jgi:hypothetical protein